MLPLASRSQSTFSRQPQYLLQQKCLVHTLLSISHETSKKTRVCQSQRPRFNKISTFYGFIKDILKWNYMCVTAKSTLTLSWFVLRACSFTQHPICPVRNVSMLTSRPPWRSTRTHENQRTHGEPVFSTMLKGHSQSYLLIHILNLGDEVLEAELLEELLFFLYSIYVFKFWCTQPNCSLNWLK